MKIEMYLPEKIFSNEQLAAEFPDWSASKIEKKIGIRNRHIVSENETALDMAFQASRKLLVNYDKSQIDYLLICTQSPDYYLPTSACLLQDRLELKTEIGALDFNLGCSGFVYGLSLAKGLLIGNMASCILLVMSETYSKHLHPKDKGNRTIFGDAAAASLLTRDDVDKIHEFALGTDGSGWQNLIIPNGGLKSHYDPEAEDWIDERGAVRNDNNLYMNGPEIFNFTIEAVPKLVNQVLDKNKCNLNDIDYVIFHQANKYMLEYLRELIDIPPEKFFMDMLETGNTVSATIPIALKKCLDQKIVKSGDKVMLVGFGVGYSYGATIITI